MLTNLISDYRDDLLFAHILIFLRIIGEIPKTAHGEQIPPPPIFDFVYFLFYAYFRLGYIKVRLPRRVRKEV